MAKGWRKGGAWGSNQERTHAKIGVSPVFSGVYRSGREDLNLRPLDPQSVSGVAGTFTHIAETRFCQARTRLRSDVLRWLPVRFRFVSGCQLPWRAPWRAPPRPLSHATRPTGLTSHPAPVASRGARGNGPDDKASRRAAKDKGERRAAARKLDIPVADVALSMTELAKTIGISRQATTKHIARPGWPQSKTPPWSKSAYAEWHRRLIPIDNAAPHRADKAKRQATGPDEKPTGDGERFGRLVGELTDRYALDPRFWLRAIVGLIEELDTGGPAIRIPVGIKGWPEERKREFIGGVSKRTHEYHARLKKLPLATDAAVEHLLKTDTFAHESPDAADGPDSTE